MVKLNGVQLNIDGKTLLHYLEEANYNLSRVAVDINGTIVPKAKYGETILLDGDTVEVVSFVAGG